MAQPVLSNSPDAEEQEKKEDCIPSTPTLYPMK